MLCGEKTILDKSLLRVPLPSPGNEAVVAGLTKGSAENVLRGVALGRGAFRFPSYAKVEGIYSSTAKVL